MSDRKDSKSIARLEARVSSEIKELWQKAAALEGVTLTDFVIASVQTRAQQVIEQHQIIKLSSRDSEAFVEALLNPSPPSEALKSAVSRYQKIIEDNDSQS